MKIYKISQNTNTSYDTYDSAIVAANNEEEARNLYPGGIHEFTNIMFDWTTPENVEVEQIGITKLYSQPQVILASFNAG